MSPELETRIYENVVRAVLWGTERDEVFQTLQANGITGEQAERMFRRARRERVAMLRGEGFQKAAKGAVLLAGAVVVFCIFWFGLGAITRAIFVICGLLGAWGSWWFLHGLLDMLLAPAKKGSVAS